MSTQETIAQTKNKKMGEVEGKGRRREERERETTKTRSKQRPREVVGESRRGRVVVVLCSASELAGVVVVAGRPNCRWFCCPSVSCACVCTFDFTRER